MARVLSGIVFLLAVAAGADSIVIDGVEVEGVYIVESGTLYYVNNPQDGSIRVVRKSDIPADDVSFSKDRDALKEQWKAVKLPSGAGESPVEEAPGEALGPKHPERSFEERRRIAVLAEFERQSGYWDTLPDEYRRDMFTSYGEALDKARARSQEAARAAAAQVAVKKEQRDKKVSQMAAELEVVLDNPELDYNAKKLEHWGRWQKVDMMYGQTNEFTDQAVLYYALGTKKEAEKVLKESDKVIRKRGSEIRSVEAELGTLQRLSIGQATTMGQSVDTLKSALGRIISLEGALRQEYSPQLQTFLVESWDGEHSQKTETFLVHSAPWRIDYAGDITITVYNADTARPITRLSGQDFLGLGYRVMNDTGRYYLEIKAKVAMPYSVHVVEFDLN